MPLRAHIRASNLPSATAERCSMMPFLKLQFFIFGKKKGGKNRRESAVIKSRYNTGIEVMV
jgi:hypothetical protein